MNTLFIGEREEVARIGPSAYILCGFVDPAATRLETFREKLVRVSGLGAPGTNARRIARFYANPRSLEYLLELAETFRQVNNLRGPHTTFLEDCWPTSKIPGEILENLRHFAKGDGEAVVTDLRAGGVAAVFLVYPDALGSNSVEIERAVATAFPGFVYVINGRRRAFRLDRNWRSKLRLRRFLTRWRYLDALIGLALIPVAATLAFREALSQRKRSDG